MSTPAPDRFPDGAEIWPISHDLAALRDLVHQHGQRAGLRSQRGDDLALAVNEAVTNVLDHAGGRGWVRFWADDAFLTVDVVDRAGRLGPEARPDERPPAGPHGYGLWVMHHLCDEVVITQDSGTSQVRLRMKRTQANGRPGRHLSEATRPSPS